MRLMRVCLMTVAALLGFGLQTTTYAADGSAYKLAYVSYSDKEIWTVNPDGMGAQPLTHDETDKLGLIPSPDGHYLAYYADSRYEYGSTFQKIMVTNVDTGEQKALTDDESITELAWSPDSEQILCALLTPHEDLSTDYALTLINRDGSGRHVLAEGVSTVSGLSWSPDGKHILLAGQNAGTYHITIMNADGSQPKPIVDVESCFICASPQWTPDSQLIVYYRHPDLFVVGTDGRNLRQLTDFTPVYNVVDVAYARYGVPSFGFSADSRTLYYTMGYPVQIVKMDMGENGWAKRTVLYDESSSIIKGSQLSPDGKLLFFNADSSNGNVLSSLDLTTHEVHSLATNASSSVIVAGE